MRIAQVHRAQSVVPLVHHGVNDVSQRFVHVEQLQLSRTIEYKVCVSLNGANASLSQSAFFSRYSMQYTIAPFGPNPYSSCTSSTLIKSSIVTAASYGATSFAGSRSRSPRDDPEFEKVLHADAVRRLPGAGRAGDELPEPHDDASRRDERARGVGANVSDDDECGRKRERE